MVPLVRRTGKFPSAAMALALGIWGLSGGSAMAQGRGAGAGITGGQAAGAMGGPGGQNLLADYGYGGTPNGVPGAPPGSYGGAPGMPPGSYGAPYGGAAYGNAAYGGAVPIVYGPGPGTFGIGYPGYGLEHGHGCTVGIHHGRQGHFARNWCSDLLAKECFYPYYADPYSDPAAALGFWPPYSAPVAGTVYRPGY